MVRLFITMVVKHLRITYIRKNPRRETTKLFEKLGLSLEHVDSAMEAMKTDSQAGIPGFGSKEEVKLTKT